MHLTERELAARTPVWHALSTLFTARELQDYDYQWMARTLNASGMSREIIWMILDEEVTPALQANLLYNPTPELDGWSEEESQQLITAYICRKPTWIERIIPQRILHKQRRKYIYREVSRLAMEMEKTRNTHG
ncbi:hypothetical protein [Kosakonia sp.]|uniref:DUF7079 family protein n=1 Tax=Kosakonia sp. TaxID=1916651 RepID=UPI002897ED6F|nr:hypothetical protein [Kosakonia sp.]